MRRFSKLTCSFCRRDETRVAKLVAGPGVYICDRCVAMAQSIMDASGDAPPPSAVRPGIVRRLFERIRRAWPSSSGPLCLEPRSVDADAV